MSNITSIRHCQECNGTFISQRSGAKFSENPVYRRAPNAILVVATCSESDSTSFAKRMD